MFLSVCSKPFFYVEIKKCRAVERCRVAFQPQEAGGGSGLSHEKKSRFLRVPIGIGSKIIGPTADSAIKTGVKMHRMQK